MLDAIPQMVWSTLPDGFHDFYNARWYEFTGVPMGSTDGEAWNGMFHPDDQERAWGTWQCSLETGAPYEIEYRLRHFSGQYRWTLGRALPVRDADGKITRWFGTCTDIHDLKQAEEERALIAAELSHRIKNIFTVIASLMTLSARGHEAMRPYIETIQRRIGALARANDYVRPHSPHSAPTGGGDLQGLIHSLVEAYQDDGPGRITVTGDNADIGPRSATSLALVIHELATNAVKYGGLSVADGQVAISIHAVGDTIILVWRESGGPAVAGAPERQGFGTEMAERAVQAQLRAVIDRQWLADGLVMTLDMPRSELRR